MITQNTIQQITNRLDIVEIVGEFVKLKKRGANYLGNCPFHNEKTPSFTVSPSKEIYKCFGCGKSGNAIGFVMDHEKYSYVEALKWLAARYNIEIEETEVSAEVRQQQQVADSLFILNSFAQKYFTNNLYETEEGKSIALTYLRHRGFNNPVIDKFQLGYCLDARDELANTLKANQFNNDIAVRSGLVVERNDALMDNYRGRIIFPIHNHSGKIIGFGARVIKSTDRAPKYINTPENEIYVKSKVLYGSYFARHAIDKQDECLLVEGYTDVVSLHQAGIENVVASGGTSLTPDQLRLIKKQTNNLTIIYDGDSAGIKAALRGLDLAVEEGLDVKLVLIPDGDDPDSYVNKIGATAFRNFIETNKKDFILFQLEIKMKEAGDSTSKKSEVVNQIAETLSKINKAEDFTRQQDYIRQCADLLRIDEQGLTNLVNKFKREKIAKEEKKDLYQNTEKQEWPAKEFEPEADTLSLLFQDELQEKNMLKVLLDYGLNQWENEQTIAEFIAEELSDYSFDNPLLDKLYNIYYTQYNEGLQPSTKTLLYYHDPEIRDLVISLSIQPYELSLKWDKIMEGMKINSKDTSRQDVIKSLTFFKLKKLKRMFEENQRDMEKATSFDEQLDLVKVHSMLKAEELKLTKQLGTVILK